MISLLHGDNIVASRKELDRLKSEFRGEIIDLDGTTLSETDFIQATQSNSMFGPSRLVVIENLPKFDLSATTSEVIIWVGKKVTPPKNVTGVEFKAPASIFKFLNSMTVADFREALKDNDIQFIFIMLSRQHGVDKKKLLELDFQNKQGLLPCDFSTAIELFLLGL